MLTGKYNKKTKIVATLGPACNNKEVLVQMIQNGVDVFRVNFSHANYDEVKERINLIREIDEEFGYHTAILADLQGPKLRIGIVAEGAMLHPDDILTFTNENVEGNAEKVFMTYELFPKDVKIGEKILIDDGKLEVVVTDITAVGEVKVKVTYGGLLKPKKGVNLPDTKISLPAMTEKDFADLEFIVAEKLDWVALSFVRKAEDIIALKRIIKEKESAIKVMAKIEMPSALADLRNIIIEADGIMVARGDLGVELPVEKVPLAQRDIIRKCIHRGKPVIVATQMMESMISQVKPNRSEITDVANAVLEGADAVMLSAETATGFHPTLVVETMTKIITEVERTEYKYNRDDLRPLSHSPSFLSDAVCYNACKIAQDISADSLIGMTAGGYTAFMLSSYRPKSPLFIFTKNRALVNQLSLSWGVRAFYYNKENSLDEIIADQIGRLKQMGFLKSGDVVVNTGSTPVHLHLPTNVLKISKVE